MEAVLSINVSAASEDEALSKINNWWTATRRRLPIDSKVCYKNISTPRELSSLEAIDLTEEILTCLESILGDLSKVPIQVATKTLFDTRPDLAKRADALWRHPEAVIAVAWRERNQNEKV